MNAANIFTTSPAIPQHHLVALDDPEHNFMAGNVVPLVNSQKRSERLKLVLDAVSAKLTTPAWPGSTPRCRELRRRPRPGCPKLVAGQRIKPPDRTLT